MYPRYLLDQTAFQNEIEAILTDNLGSELDDPFLEKRIKLLHDEYEDDDNLATFIDNPYQMIINDAQIDRPSELADIVSELDDLLHSKGYPHDSNGEEVKKNLFINTLIYLLNLEKERGNPYLVDAEYQDYEEPF